MAPMGGYHLDILATEDGEIMGTDVPARRERAAEGRPWIGVRFECCGVYTRVYRDPAVPRYDGNCPVCGRSLVVRVGPDGISGRLFRARPT